MQEAGVETAYSLVRLTGPLLAPRWTIDKIAGLNALIALRNDAAKAFNRGARAMSQASWITDEEVEAWQRQADALDDEIDPPT